MNEESIKSFLTTCVYQEMNSFHPSQEEEYNHEFSKIQETMEALKLE